MKFEMNKETLWTLKTDANTFLTNTGMVERKYSLLGYPVVINTNKPDGIVQLGRDSIDLTYTDNIRASLESLVRVAKMREDGSLTPQMIGRGLRRKQAPEELRVVNVNQEQLDELRSAFSARSKGSRGDLEAMSLYCKQDADATVEFVKEHVRKDLFSLTEALSTWVNSEEDSLTIYVVADSVSCDYKSDTLWDTVVSLSGVPAPYDKSTCTITTTGNRRIQVVTKNQASKITEPCQVVYDHTVQGN